MVSRIPRDFLNSLEFRSQELEFNEIPAKGVHVSSRMKALPLAVGNYSLAEHFALWPRIEIRSEEFELKSIEIHS